MQEIWKDIDGYNGLYQVSNLGNVKSRKKSGAFKNDHILIPSKTRGYPTVGLFKDGKKKTLLIHRLVAEAFIPNPQNYAEVNHKDENKQNNNVENLEWCSRSYNMAYKTARVRQGVTLGRPIVQCTKDGIQIAKYCSAEVASKLLNIDSSSIHKCCLGKRDYAGGYIWRYITSSNSI